MGLLLLSDTIFHNIRYPGETRPIVGHRSALILDLIFEKRIQILVATLGWKCQLMEFFSEFSVNYIKIFDFNGRVLPANRHELVMIQMTQYIRSELMTLP